MGGTLWALRTVVVLAVIAPGCAAHEAPRDAEVQEVSVGPPGAARELPTLSPRAQGCLDEFSRAKGYGLGPDHDPEVVAAHCKCDPATLISYRAALCLADLNGLEEGRAPWTATLGGLSGVGPVWSVEKRTTRRGELHRLDARSGALLQRLGRRYYRYGRKAGTVTEARALEIAKQRLKKECHDFDGWKATRVTDGNWSVTCEPAVGGGTAILTATVDGETGEVLSLIGKESIGFQ